MKRRALIAAALLGCAASWVAAASPRQPRSPAPADAAAALAPDKGKLKILQEGVQAGTEEFELTQSGNAWIERGEAVVKVSGSETRSSGQLRFDADGTPLHYEWTAQAKDKASGTVDFQNGTAKTSLHLGSKEPVLEDFKFTSPRVAILDNNQYEQYAILARLYDWTTGGTQNFPVLIPQDMTPGNIVVESLGSKTIEGAALEELRVHTADVEIDVYLDAKHRLMRLEVPDAKVVIVRE